MTGLVESYGVIGTIIPVPFYGPPSSRIPLLDRWQLVPANRFACSDISADICKGLSGCA